MNCHPLTVVRSADFSIACLPALPTECGGHEFDCSFAVLPASALCLSDREVGNGLLLPLVAAMAGAVAQRSNFFVAVKKTPASVVELVICFFSVWSILGLAGFHTYLMSSNQTTNEDIKGSFSSKRSAAAASAPKNPFSTGSVFSNCCLILCGPTHPRYNRSL